MGDLMSLQPNKTDPKLGAEIEAYLITKGVNTPTIKQALEVDTAQKKKTIEE